MRGTLGCTEAVGGHCRASDRCEKELRRGTDGCWLLGLRRLCVRGGEQNGLFLALKPGNVATFGPTSRRYREKN